MKKLISLLSFGLITAGLYAQAPYDIYFNQKEPGGQYNVIKWVTPYSSKVSLHATDSSLTPIMYFVDSDFRIVSGELKIGTQFATITDVSNAIAAFIPSRSFNNAPGRSIVTTAGAANGTQISSTRDAQVFYSVTTSTTSTIAGASSATVVLEICSTNSATAGNWIEVARTTNNTNVTLAVALQLVNVQASTLSAIVPAGYYSRIRQTLTGTSSASISSGQEVLL